MDVLNPAVEAIDGKGIHAQSQEDGKSVLQGRDSPHEIVEVLRPGEEVVLETLHVVHREKPWVELGRDEEKYEGNPNEDFECLLNPFRLNKRVVRGYEEYVPFREFAW